MVITDRPFPPGSDPEALLPAVTPANAPFWDGLADGTITVQRCASCRSFRFPVAPVCPHCGGTGFGWEPVRGRGTVFSWVRYGRSFLPEFADVMPYVVVCAQLDEGVRMFGRLADEGAADPAIGDPLDAEIERWPGGRCVVRFRRPTG